MQAYNFLSKEKERILLGLPPMSTLMITVTMNNQSVSLHIPSVFVRVH